MRLLLPFVKLSVVKPSTKRASQMLFLATYSLSCDKGGQQQKEINLSNLPEMIMQHTNSITALNFLVYRGFSRVHKIMGQKEENKI
jgi:hypothetical protein